MSNFKPFNLEAALAGAPVVTRCGEKVTQLTRFIAAAERYNLVGVVDQLMIRWDRFGVAANSNESLGLFMALTKKTGWIAHRSSSHRSSLRDLCECVCSTKEQLIKQLHIDEDDLDWVIQEISWEE